MKMMKWQFVPVVLLLSFLAYGMFSWYENEYNRLPVYGQILPGTRQEKAHYIRPFNLINQENAIAGTQAWKDKIVVVNFFFTHCASICPKMTVNLQEVQHAYKNDNKVLINSLTVDPEADSVSQLRQYRKRFGIQSDKWQLLTGSKKDIYRLARNEFLLVATDGDGGPNDFIHSDKVVLIDPEKRIRGYYNGTDKQEIHQLMLDIKKLQHEN
ncbi:MAG: SCO family protein [Williamsia sp.]|nr:SCO family protein [Williamsia sp.]